jgi:hypothetical protein
MFMFAHPLLFFILLAVLVVFALVVRSIRGPRGD